MSARPELCVYVCWLSMAIVPRYKAGPYMSRWHLLCGEYKGRDLWSIFYYRMYFKVDSVPLIQKETVPRIQQSVPRHVRILDTQKSCGNTLFHFNEMKLRHSTGDAGSTWRRRVNHWQGSHWLLIGDMVPSKLMAEYPSGNNKMSRGEERGSIFRQLCSDTALQAL